MSDSRAVALTRELIRCPSVTPADAGALDVVENELKAVGFETHRIVFSAPGTPDIDNLFAKIGSGAPHLAFAGHTDVVPPGDPARWRFDPFAAEISDGRVYGRGASDMKGAIAAFVAAALAYVERHNVPQGTLSLLITGDEEGVSINGTVKLLEWARSRGERFEHC
ncbi:MAG: M20/M25/M40 family metallo-hydrolase, partial [Methylocystis sp.]|nr:M20/M25/M40 family metallo-hydrolase [Methylocystis sp.]